MDAKVSHENLMLWPLLLSIPTWALYRGSNTIQSCHAKINHLVCNLQIKQTGLHMNVGMHGYVHQLYMHWHLPLIQMVLQRTVLFLLE